MNDRGYQCTSKIASDRISMQNSIWMQSDGVKYYGKTNSPILTCKQENDDPMEVL